MASFYFVSISFFNNSASARLWRMPSHLRFGPFPHWRIQGTNFRVISLLPLQSFSASPANSVRLPQLGPAQSSRVWVSVSRSRG